MTNRQQPKTKYPRKEVPCKAGESEEHSMRNLAILATSPAFAASRVINATEGAAGIGKELDIPALLEVLHDQGDAANANDLAQAEAMLMNQAVALQGLFAKLTERAMNAEYMDNLEAYMKLALRAQNQCRQTVEALSAVKNPPVVYAKQANIAQGPQQINNGVDSRARNDKIKPNELSAGRNELLQDDRASAAESRVDSMLETLGEVHRAKDFSR